MNTGHALIVCEDATHGAVAADKLQALGFNAALCSPDEFAAAPASRAAADVVCICHCHHAITQRVLMVVEIDHAESLVPTIVADAPAGRTDASVQLMPSTTVSSTQFNGEIAGLVASAEQARKTGVRCDVRFRMVSDCKFIDALNLQLRQLYQRFGMDGESEHRLTTAVREMVHNAVEWGNRGVSEACVLVRCTINAFSATILITDSGQGFNREELPHAATSQDPVRHLNVRDQLGLRTGGFGILMTRGLVDDLSYNEDGNEVRIVKYFNQPQ